MIWIFLLQLQLCDTIGGENCGFDTKEESKALRRHYYENAYIVLLCYSTDDIDALQEIQKYIENVRIDSR
jgi:GTPase SAR1 family protein